MKIRSFWQKQALERESAVPLPSLQGLQKADIAIVGGGFCGLWTAIELKQRDATLDVAILEKEYCGSGASGRNAGILLDLWPRALPMMHMFGTDEGLRVARAAAANVTELLDFCAAHGIDAHCRRNGWLWGATCAAQAHTWRPMMEVLARHGHQPFIEQDPAELRDRYGLKGHVAGALAPDSGSLQPALLARGLLRVAHGLGVRIFENSEVTRFDLGTRNTLSTAGGQLKADKVVLAMNAWAIRFGQIRRGIAVVAAEAAISAPVPELIGKLNWTDGPSFTDSRVPVTNYQATADGRIEFGKAGPAIAFGGRISDAVERGPTKLPLMMQEMREAVPATAAVTPEMAWVGPVDRAYDGLPVFGHLNGLANVSYGVGFSGNGVGPTRLGGKILASMALGATDEWSSLALVRAPSRTFPPEPFRAVGARLVYGAVLRKDRAEHAGTAPGPLTRALAALAPSPLIPQDSGA